MKFKKILSCAAAAGTALSAFAGTTLTAEAAANTVEFRPQGAEQAVVLTADHLEYDHDSDGVSDIVFDDENDTLTFNSDITLVSRNSGSIDEVFYFGCIIVRNTGGAKSITMVIPEGVTVTMDNTENANDWAAALYGSPAGSVTITGGGKLDIKGGGGSSNGYGIAPSGQAVKIDGAKVTVSGAAYGVGYYGSGSLTVTNGGTLEAAGGMAAFDSASVTVDEGTAIVGGADASNTKDITTSEIASYKYVRIGGEPSGPVEVDPDLPTENFSSWVGIQTEENGKTEWLYNNHYILQDGTHSYGSPDGSESILYENGTLIFKRDITIYGVQESPGKYYGSAIPWKFVETGDVDTNMVIRLENGANVTMDATNREAYAYLYGIYGTGTLVVTGDGTLTIKSNNGTSDNYAMCVYNGKEGASLGNIIIKDNVKLKLTNEDANGIALGVYGPGAGAITIKDNAVVEAYGGAKAINKPPVMPENASVKVGASADAAAAWDKTSDITQYKYVKIDAGAEEQPAVFTQTTSEAITENDGKTGFVTVISGTAGTTIQKISWNITSNRNTRVREPETQPQITLDSSAQAVFAVIVEGLSDPDATAYATAE